VPPQRILVARILGHDELPDNCVVLPRSAGTPIKLLGCPDGSMSVLPLFLFFLVSVSFLHLWMQRLGDFHCLFSHENVNGKAKTMIN
jgi:hypothetical protein